MTGLVIQQHTVHAEQQAHLSAGEKQFSKGGAIIYAFSLNKICKSHFFTGGLTQFQYIQYQLSDIHRDPDIFRI